MAVWTSRSSWEDDNDVVYPAQPVQGKNVELSRIALTHLESLDADASAGHQV